MQVLAGDPMADPRRDRGARGARLPLAAAAPVVCEDRAVGMLEAYSRGDRPWSRFEIRRARIIAHQLGAALERIERRAGAVYSR